MHSRDLRCVQENHQYLVGSAKCFIRDLLMAHVVLVWRYTKVGTAWSHVGAHLVAVPLGGSRAPLAYTTLEDKLGAAIAP